VLLDWLLLDAPLQHLRGDDAQWRLRISVNGDSFLVDRQTPLWLKGFKRGSNAVQLELLDGRGDPLNPPFNSLVREVVIGGGNRPAWLKASLSPDELARLSGEAPPEPEPQPEPEPEPQPTPVPAARQPSAPKPEPDAEAEPEPEPEQEPAIAAASAEAVAAPTPEEHFEKPALEPLQERLQQPEPVAPSQPAPATAAAPENVEEIAAASAPARSEEPPSESPPAAPPISPVASAELNLELPPPPQPVAPQERPSAGAAESERMAPTTSLAGSAREQVRADGSLLQPKPRGPLAGLREKLGG
jgi:hypothetical protein